MIVEFHDRDGRRFHDEFQAWRRSHLEDGYFLTFKTKSRAVLHVSHCWHSGGVIWDGENPYKDGAKKVSLTSKRKTCSDDRAELLAWASSNEIQVSLCAHCLYLSSGAVEGRNATLVESSKAPNDLNDVAQAIEGIAREITITVRSRSEPLRRAALDRARGICEACGTDYSGLAGGLGKRVLQVHHRKQLALADEPVTTSLDDLAVVCANCHLMIHTDAANSLSVEDLRKLFVESNEA
jgi:predicted HNH restriction endonuclease